MNSICEISLNINRHHMSGVRFMFEETGKNKHGRFMHQNTNWQKKGVTDYRNKPVLEKIPACETTST